MEFFPKKITYLDFIKENEGIYKITKASIPSIYRWDCSFHSNPNIHFIGRK